MNKTFSKYKRIATLLTGISFAAIPAIVHADWSIKLLSPGQRSIAFGINDSGQVVGEARFSDTHTHAFITGPDGVGMMSLGALGEEWSNAFAINNSGQVVGSVTSNNSAPPHAYISGPNGIGMTDLGTFGESSSLALGINDSGQAVIYAYTESNGQTFLTGPNGTGITKIDTGSQSTYSAGINNSGQVAGHYEAPGGLHAFITGPNGVGLTDLDTLGGSSSLVSGINNSGQVVGTSSIAGNSASHAYVTGPNGSGITDLGTLGEQYYYSQANANNDLGEVVGFSSTSLSGNDHESFLFSHGGITNLSTLPVVVAAGLANIRAWDINNNGQIVGFGHPISGGDFQAFLLSYTSDTIFNPSPIYIPPSPIPEPQTYAMLLAGLGLIGFMVRRRKESEI